MDVGMLMVFALACVPVAIAPGPAVAYIVTTGLSSGKRGGMGAVAGVEMGNLVHVVAAAAGVSAVLAASAEAFTVVKILGALYLVWLGVQAWRSRDERRLKDLGKAEARKDVLPAMRRGLVIGTFNPKTAVFFLAFLPQFVQVNGVPVWQQMLLLGIIFVVLASVFDLVWATASGALRIALPGLRMKVLSRFSGTVYFGLAAVSLTARRSASAAS